ncbi:MAG: hypothetical protein ACI9W6_001067 [Motiliproteus sp.]|jgi:hypothetical protein
MLISATEYEGGLNNRGGRSGRATDVVRKPPRCPGATVKNPQAKTDVALALHGLTVLTAVAIKDNLRTKSAMYDYRIKSVRYGYVESTLGLGAVVALVAIGLQCYGD